ncbi:hypothetical protein AB0M47_15050, partial [Hamadaea sp. NPDC051192]|uniref:hypothetical protein n=1 Tax=Hamadaea sp. NPDC051192 TaxID=3154940 RepID=UPI003425AC9C
MSVSIRRRCRSRIRLRSSERASLNAPTPACRPRRVDHTLTLRIVGKNAASGGYFAGVDQIVITSSGI